MITTCDPTDWDAKLNKNRILGPDKIIDLEFALIIQGVRG